ncbi:hypothetical protein L6R52_15055 [Myxococcota bacterium]|nr:hypothetical protein [Myxococcota bacterium]
MTDALATRCGLVIGKLLTHPCARPATHVCIVCQRGTCESHRAVGRRQLCAECAKERPEFQGRLDVTLDEMIAFERGELDAFGPTAPSERARFDS